VTLASVTLRYGAKPTGASNSAPEAGYGCSFSLASAGKEQSSYLIGADSDRPHLLDNQAYCCKETSFPGNSILLFCFLSCK
jgi:hypothetical protein